MIKKILTLVIGMSLTALAMAVEDIYITDTLRELPQEMQRDALFAKALKYRGTAASSDTFRHLLEQVLALDSTSSACYDELCTHYLLRGRASEALKMKKKALELYPDNYWYMRSLAALYKRMGQTMACISVYKDIVRLFPDKKQPKLELASLYSDTGLFSEALQMWDEYETLAGASLPVTETKMKIYAAQGNKAMVRKEAEKYISTDPTTVETLVEMARVCGSIGYYDYTKTLCKRVSKKFPSDKAQVSPTLFSIYMTEGKREEAIAELRRILSDPDVLDYDEKSALLGVAGADSTISDLITESDYKALISLYPYKGAPYMAYGKYLERRGDPGAQGQLQKAVEVNPSDADAWLLLLNYHTDHQDTATYRSCLGKALKAVPDDPTILASSAEQDIDDGRRLRAIEKWKKAYQIFKEEEKNDEMASFVAGCIGSTFTELKEADLDSTLTKPEALDSAFAWYDRALKLNQKNATVLNNYAYYLAENNRELDKAEYMAGMAVALKPTEPSYADTYAWVYYKRGKYTSALMYIQKAINASAGCRECGEIYEHYGDILYKTGDKAGALKAWKKSLEMTKTPTEALKKKVETQKLQ